MRYTVHSIFQLLEFLWLSVFSGDEFIGHGDIRTEIKLVILLPGENLERPKYILFKSAPNDINRRYEPIIGKALFPMKHVES